MCKISQNEFCFKEEKTFTEWLNHLKPRKLSEFPSEYPTYDSDYVFFVDNEAPKLTIGDYIRGIVNQELSKQSINK